MGEYLQYIIPAAIGFVAGIIGGYLANPPKKQETQIVVVDGKDEETETASIPAMEHNMPGAVGISGPVPPPQPKEESLTPQELEKKRLELVTSFPELEIIISNLDKFKKILATPKINVPDNVKPSTVLMARRISDMVYKHQKLLLGLSKLTKERLFAATVTLLEEKTQGH